MHERHYHIIAHQHQALSFGLSVQDIALLDIMWPLPVDPVIVQRSSQNYDVVIYLDGHVTGNELAAT